MTYPPEPPPQYGPPQQPYGPPPQSPPYAPPKQKRKRWPWIAGAVVLVIVIAVAVSSSKKKKHDAAATVGAGTSAASTAPASPVKTAPTKATKPKPPSDTVAVEVGGAKASVRVSGFKLATPSQFVTVKGTLYSAVVTITVTSGKFDVNPLLFSARSAGGDNYNVSLGGTDDQIAAVTVPEGQTLRGTVAFDVPKGQKIDIIVMSTVLGDQLGTWKVAGA